MSFPTMWYVRPLLVLEYSLNIKLLNEHNLEFLSLKGGCTGSSESIHVKMPHCWKSIVMVQISMADVASPGMNCSCDECCAFGNIRSCLGSMWQQ